MVIDKTPLPLKTANYPTQEEIRTKLTSVNYHLIKACNYRCTFCFAQFKQISTNYLPKLDSLKLISILAENGTQKITFVGGEPTLVPFLPELVIHAKSLGMTTMVVTNGTKLKREYLAKFQNCLDWVGLSIDSTDEGISKELGRGFGSHVNQTIDNAKLLREFSIRIKLNTVVTEKTWNEDMSWLLEEIRPERWKIFKILLIHGENDEARSLQITNRQFQYFISQHDDHNPIAEENEDMIDSYIMIDPEGRFYNNSNHRLDHGPQILSVGIETAISLLNFSELKFNDRGGLYQWN